MYKAVETTVAFLIFNRPDLTQLVFNEIAKAKPKKLLIIADGPRNEAEAEKCNQARAVVEKVDWGCEVLKNYSDFNLGCRKRVSSGLDWVFSLVDEAIILEDDCLPAPSFFYFCQELIEYYRYDTRIMHISGDNFQLGNKRTEYSYYYSKYVHVWGWATWKRAWKYYDVNIEHWPQYKSEKLIQTKCPNLLEQKYWEGIFDKVYAGEIDTWDYQWVLTCWSQYGLAIIPNNNLVSNIGFRSDATHTKKTVNPLANIATINIEQILHPSYMLPDLLADEYTFKKWLRKTRKFPQHLITNFFLNNNLKEVNKRSWLNIPTRKR